MKVVKYLLTLICLNILASCGDGKVSDSVVEETANAILSLGNSDKVAFLPIGDVTFDESLTDSYGFLGERKITMEQFLSLQEAGLITVEQKERQGGIYRIIVGLTPEGEKYLNGEPKLQGTVAFVAMKGGNKKFGKILNKEYNEEAGKGYAFYTIVLDKITPFGEILEGFKKGDIVSGKESMELTRGKDGTWKPYTILDYMAK